MRTLLLLLFIPTASAFATTDPPFIRGKVLQRDGQFYVTMAPEGNFPIYNIQWVKGYDTANICFYQRDKLCPDYVIYFRTLKHSKSGTLLVDAVADPKF